MYNAEIELVQKNYQLVSQLDIDLLKEFDITPPKIMQCLKDRLAGLRKEYWQELFSKMKEVTDRLTSKKRNELLNQLNESGSVDFTPSNIVAIVLWVLKNANIYLDEQLITVFEEMASKANVSGTRAISGFLKRMNGGIVRTAPPISRLNIGSFLHGTGWTAHGEIFG